MTTPPIYLDNHATTPMDRRVFDFMLPYFLEHFGNPASKSHCYGWKAAACVDEARVQVASSLGAHESEIIFTSGATESNNTAIKGAAHYCQKKGKHIITSSIEHKSVLDSCANLKEQGFDISYIAPNRDGLIEVEKIEKEVRADTVLLSFMLANNEIGTINPVQQIGELARRKGVIFHCDAVQGFGRIPLSVADFHVDLLSLSAHKIYGPKGVGALFVRKTTGRCLEPLIHGGGQEFNLRSGTLNVPGIAGLAKACSLAAETQESECERIATLRNHLVQMLSESIPHLRINGCLKNRVPGNLSVSIPNIDAEELMLLVCDKVALSSGSACSSAQQKPSHVLQALKDFDDLSATLRFGIGRFNSTADIRAAAQIVGQAVKELSSASKKRFITLS